MCNATNLLLFICLSVAVVDVVNSYTYYSPYSSTRISREVKHGNNANGKNKDGPNREGSCTLPEHPKNGKWNVQGATKTYSPGETVGNQTILRVSCNRGYKSDGQNFIPCEEGTWSSHIGRCAKTCPPIDDTPHLKVTCENSNQQIVNCSEAIDGTIAKFKCDDFYEDLGLANVPVHICKDGTWNQRKPQCTPVCGQKSVTATTLIVNGTTVKRGEYPWQVALYNKSNELLICGGSLISQRVILTAAHCVTNDHAKLESKDNYLVAVGKYYRPFNDVRDKTESQVSELEAMFIPRQYKGATQDYLGDIAVLVTKTAFTLSTRVQPVCVDWRLNYQSEVTRPLMTKYGYVTGWGFTAENANPSEELKEVKVPSVTYEQCAQGLPQDFQQFLTSDKICAGFLDQGTSVCKGDGGGGLVYKHGKRYYITGIASLSPQSPTGGCSSQYGLYTNVYKYIDDFINIKVVEYKVAK